MQSGRKEKAESASAQVSTDSMQAAVPAYTISKVSGPPEFVALFNKIKGICEPGGDLSQLPREWDKMQRLCGEMVDSFSLEVLEIYKKFLDSPRLKDPKLDPSKITSKDGDLYIFGLTNEMDFWIKDLFLAAGESSEFRTLLLTSLINMAYKAAFENHDYYTSASIIGSIRSAAVVKLIGGIKEGDFEISLPLPEEVRARYDRLSATVVNKGGGYRSYRGEVRKAPYALPNPGILLGDMTRKVEGDKVVSVGQRSRVEANKSRQQIMGVVVSVNKATAAYEGKKKIDLGFLKDYSFARSAGDRDDADKKIYELVGALAKKLELIDVRDIFREAKLVSESIKKLTLAYNAIAEATEELGFYIHDDAKQALAEALLTGDKEKVVAVLLNRKEHGFVKFTSREDGEVPDAGKIADSLMKRTTEKSLPDGFGDAVINGNPESIARVLKEGGIDITPEQAIDIKQNYYRSKIASPLFREQIRATRVDIHINKQIDPTITAQARLHAFRSTTEYVISKINEAQADKDFAAMAKYLPMLGFSEPQARQLIELQQAYIAIDSNIEKRIFSIEGIEAGEAKKALAEALLNVGNTDKDPVKKRQAGIAKVVGVLKKYEFVLLPPDKSTNIRLVNRVVYSDVLDEFARKMLSHPLKAAREALGKALLSGDKAKIVAVLTSPAVPTSGLIGFGMPEGKAADEMVLELQRRLAAQVLQEKFSPTFSPPADRFRKLQEDISEICGEDGDLSQLPEKWEEMQKVFGEIVNGFSSEATKSFVSLANDPTELFNTKLFDKKKKKKVTATRAEGQEGLVDEKGNPVAVKDEKGNSYIPAMVEVNGNEEPLKDAKGNYVYYLVDDKTKKDVYVDTDEDECPNVASLVRLQEGISFWARDLILKNPNPSVCALSLASVINAAFQAAYVKHDYLTAMALYSTLNMAQVSRLKNVFDLLPENVKQQYATLKELYSPDGHFAIYEKTIKQISGVAVAIPMPSQVINDTTLIVEANAPDEARKLMAAKVVEPLRNLMQKAQSERIPQTVDLVGVVSVDQKQLDEKSQKIVPRSPAGAPPAKLRHIFEEVNLKANPIVLSKGDAFSMLPEWLSKVLEEHTEQSQIAYNDIQEILKAVENPPSSKDFIKKLVKLGIKEEVAAEHVRFIKDRAYLNKIDSLIVRELLASNHVEGKNPGHIRRGKTIKLIEKLNEAVKNGNYEVMLTVSKEFGIDLAKILTKEQFGAIKSKMGNIKISDLVSSHSDMKLFLVSIEGKLKEHKDISFEERKVLEGYVKSLEVFAKVNSNAEKLLKEMQELSGRVSLVESQRQQQVVITPSQVVIPSQTAAPLATSAPKSGSEAPYSETQLKEQHEKPLPAYPPLTKQVNNPLQLGNVRNVLNKECHDDQKMRDYVDKAVGQSVGKARAVGEQVTVNDMVTMIKEASKAVKLSRAEQATPEPEFVVTTRRP